MPTKDLPQAPSAGESAQPIRSHSDPLDFFRDVRDLAQRAADQAGLTDRFVSVAGKTVRLSFAGEALAPLLMPAIEHLAADPEESASLTVHIWDSASTGVQMPRPAWPVDAVRFRGDVQGFNDTRISTAFQADASLLSMLDSESSEAVYWIRDFRDVPSYERAAPLLRIFHWWLGKHGQQVVHGAAVGTPGRGVLIAGKGGSGKSSTALACANAGLKYAADDYCILSPNPAPTVWSLYNSGKTHGKDVEELPFLASFVANPNRSGDEKALYFLHEKLSAQLIRQFPLRAILLPRVTGRRDTAVRSAAPSAGVLALSPSTMSQLPGSSGNTVAIIARVCREIPVYHLDLGTDRDQIPQVISTLLASA